MVSVVRLVFVVVDAASSKRIHRTCRAVGRKEATILSGSAQCVACAQPPRLVVS